MSSTSSKTQSQTLPDRNQLPFYPSSKSNTTHGFNSTLNGFTRGLDTSQTNTQLIERDEFTDRIDLYGRIGPKSWTMNTNNITNTYEYETFSSSPSPSPSTSHPTLPKGITRLNELQQLNNDTLHMLALAKRRSESKEHGKWLNGTGTLNRKTTNERNPFRSRMKPLKPITTSKYNVMNTKNKSALSISLSKPSSNRDYNNVISSVNNSIKQRTETKVKYLSSFIAPLLHHKSRLHSVIGLLKRTCEHNPIITVITRQQFVGIMGSYVVDELGIEYDVHAINGLYSSFTNSTSAIGSEGGNEVMMDLNGFLYTILAVTFLDFEFIQIQNPNVIAVDHSDNDNDNSNGEMLHHSNSNTANAHADLIQYNHNKIKYKTCLNTIKHMHHQLQSSSPSPSPSSSSFSEGLTKNDITLLLKSVCLTTEDRNTLQAHLDVIFSLDFFNSSLSARVSAVQVAATSTNSGYNTASNSNFSTSTTSNSSINTKSKFKGDKSDEVVYNLESILGNNGVLIRNSFVLDEFMRQLAVLKGLVI